MKSNKANKTSSALHTAFVCLSASMLLGLSATAMANHNDVCKPHYATAHRSLSHSWGNATWDFYAFNGMSFGGNDSVKGEVSGSFPMWVSTGDWVVSIMNRARTRVYCSTNGKVWFGGSFSRRSCQSNDTGLRRGEYTGYGSITATGTTIVTAHDDVAASLRFCN